MTPFNRERHRALGRLGHKLRKQGVFESVSPGLESLCEYIARQTGATIAKDKNSRWHAVVEFEAQLNGGKLPKPAKPPKVKKDKPLTAAKKKALRIAFYNSDEWRALRYLAIKKHGGACLACGATAQSSGKPIHVDHVKPRYLFPDLEMDLNNLQILCHDCNLGKGYKDQTDWRQAG